MVVADAERALQLTDRQYPEFLTRLRALQETRRSNLLQHLKLMAELQRLSNPRSPKPDDSTLYGRLTALQELESRSAAELRRSYNAIDERRQARFRVMEEQLERRKLELPMRARQNRLQRQQPKARTCSALD